MTGYKSKRAATRDKLVDDRRAYYEKFDDLYAVYLNGVYDGKKAAQRKPLTDEDLDLICEKALFCRISFQQFARSIEAAHGIKEKNT